MIFFDCVLEWFYVILYSCKTVHKPSLPLKILRKLLKVNTNKGVIKLTYLQDYPQQELQLGLSEFLLVDHEVVGTGLDLLSGTKTTQCIINTCYCLKAI
jgi:hypothetical protein